MERSDDIPSSSSSGLRRAFRGRRTIGAVLASAIAVSSVAIALPARAPDAPGPARAAVTPVPKPQKVAVLALENRSYGQVIGNRNAPYFNRLAKTGALATNYYAVAHPSLPNYIALTGGGTYEITRNCGSCDTGARNLANQLSTAGISWRGYFDGLTSNGRPGRITRLYNPYYNPFVYFDSVRGKTASRSNVVGFSRLNRDLRANSLPRFSWIAPSVHNDGHNGTLRQADRYASRLVPRVLRALGPRGVLYLLWEEGKRSDTAGVNGTKGGGRVALITAGGMARSGARVSTPANHYALLRTIEAGFGLPPLGKAGSATTPTLAGLLKP